MKKQFLHADTLSALLAQLKDARWRGITFIKDGASEEFLSYSQLWDEALLALGALQQAGVGAGDELILQADDNKTLLVYFWACILGKIIAVPVSTGVQEDQKLKLARIFGNLRAPYLLCDRAQAERLRKFSVRDQDVFSAIARRTLLIEDLQDTKVQGVPETVTPGDIAYLQFSSGSTGSPKGVTLTHANLVANISDIAERSEVSADDTLLSWMPLTHDMGLICFHLTGMITAARQCLIPTALFIRRPLLWIEKASTHQATRLYSPNFGYSYFLAAYEASDKNFGWNLSSIETIYNGAEPISHELCRQFTRVLAPYGLPFHSMYPGYGLAEASVAVSLPDVQDGIRSYHLDRAYLQTGDKVRLVNAGTPGSVSFMEVGYPIAHCQVRIANDEDRKLEDGCVGNIQIKGDNVTSAYYRNEEATRNLHTPDGWVRTGDLGLFISGRLVVTGRAKNIIIVNGQNYYPQDIERSAEEVEGAELGKLVACGARGRNGGAEELVLFVLFKEAAKNFLPLAARIHEAVFGKTGLTPAQIIPVRRIPKTTSGKIQHFKLLNDYLDGVYDEVITALNALRTESRADGSSLPEVEAFVLELCKNILGQKTIDINDNFFELGIISLQAAQLAHHLKKWSGQDIQLWQVLTYPTVKSLSQFIVNASAGATSITKAPQDEDYPLSEGQRRFWVLDQYGNGSAANIVLAWTLTGHVHYEALHGAIKALMARHENLRSSFALNGDEPRQIIHAAGTLCPDLSYADLRNGTDPTAVAKEKATHFANRPFDLQHAPLLRSALLQTGTDEYVLVLCVHHIIADGWSMLLVMEELEQLYDAASRNTDARLKPLRFQAKDHVHTQALQLALPSNERHQQYWTRELGPEAPVLNLPYSFARPATESYEGATQWFSLSAGQTVQLQQLAKEQGATTFMVLLSLLNTLFYKYSGQTDLVIGTDIAGRDNEDLEKQVGYFLRTLPLRSKFNGSDSFSELVGKVKTRILSAFEHDRFSLDQLMDDLGARNQGSRSPLFNVLAIYQNFQNRDRFAGLGRSVKAEAFEVEQQSSLLDLHIEFIERNGCLHFGIRYQTALFAAEQIARMGGHFRQLAGSVLANPALPLSAQVMTTLEEQKNLLNYGAGINAKYPTHQNLIHLFEAQARRNGQHTAVHFEGKEWSYEQLNAAANQVAQLLLGRFELGRNERVGLLVQPSFDMIVNMIAILKAGACFVPISASYPAERIRLILRDSGIRLLCTDGDYLGGEILSGIELLDTETISRERCYYPGDNVSSNTQAKDLAYIMYTSGSTGRPKGVMVDHAAVLDYVQTFAQYFELTDSDVVIQQSELSFDTSVEEIFPALSSGASIVVMRQNGRDIEALLAGINASSATILSTTPLVLQEIDRQNKIPDSLRLVISGGDQLKASFISRLVKKVPVYNTYGPVETTVCASYHRVSALEEASIIGRPIANKSIYIVDKDLQLVPIGVRGEICIAGSGLARGYLNNEEETQKRFVASPFFGERMYRTGDSGRWLDDGRIEFLGREDDQLKIRGYRVEPAEIERALMALNTINDAVVVPQSGASGVRLVAFYTGSELNTQAIRLALAAVLPHYMIPASFVRLDKMPVNDNGKADRKALLRYEIISEAVETGVAANDTETALVAIWMDVLQQTFTGTTDNFFELGGNSISATRIRARIHQQFNVLLPLQTIFAFPTIRQQAEHIQAAVADKWSEITRVAPQEHYEVSHAQKRIWLIDQFEEARLAYNLSWTYELTGDFNPEAFAQSLGAIMARHEILRTHFIVADGEPRQYITPSEAFQFTINQTDLCQNASKEKALEDVLEAVCGQPFDLAAGPLVRAALVRTSAETWVLALAMHHIISDGWSVQVLVDELVNGYNSRIEGSSYEPSPLAFQYKDFVYWQQAQLSSATDDRRFWLSQFDKDDVPVLDLPTDYARPVIQTYEGQTLPFFMPEALRKKLAETAAQNDTSPFVVLLSSVYALLYLYSNQEDMVLGSPVLGRERNDLEGQIGCYLNTLPLRVRFDARKGFGALLQQVKNVAMQAYAHQSYPFDLLVEELSLRPDTSRSPLFDVMVGYQNKQRAQDKLNTLAGVKATALPRDLVSSQFDLSIDFFEREEGLEGQIEFNTNLFSTAYATRFAEQLEVVLEAVLHDSTLPLRAIDFVPARQKEQLFSFNPINFTQPHYNTIQQKFEEQAALYPSRKAVVYEDRVLSYSELNRKANQVANYLRGVHGTGRGDVIGLMLGRSEQMLVYVLGILKSGAAYLPLDSENPAGRLDYIAHDSGMTVLISDRAVETPGVTRIYTEAIEEVLHNYNGDWAQGYNKREDLAYIIYTSGSTGRPKGVLVTHTNLASAAESWRTEYELDEFTICSLQIASIAFDVFAGDLCRTLLNGGCLVVCPSDARPDPRRLHELILQQGVNVLEATPALVMPLADYVQECNQFLPLRLLIVGSDVFLVDDYKKLLQQFGHGMRIINSYGTTETTIDASYYEAGVAELPSSGMVPVGKPLPNTKYYVLNDALNLLPVGVAGELCIGGEGVSRGYLNRPELNADKFIADPFAPDGRIYKTGDRVKWSADGNLLYLGRNDFQVKIRGYRIELGEIEDALLHYHGVQEAVVAAQGSGAEAALVAYYTGNETDAAVLKGWLASRLPAYMVPAVFMHLDAFELSANGKIDRKKLPQPETVFIPDSFTAPASITELRLQAIWEEVLQHRGIGTNTNFFEAGGHSLKAAKLLSRIRQTFGVRLELRTIFTHPTIAVLAPVVEAGSREQASIIEKVEDQPHYPLSLAQRRLWILDQLEEDRVAYNMPAACWLRGPLQTGLLQKALETLVVRHEVLRTRFILSGSEPRQVIDANAELEIDYIDFTNKPEQQEAIRQYVREQSLRAFDLQQGPLLRCALLQTGEEEHLFFFNMHHIISDGRSAQVLSHELGTLYNAYVEATELYPLPTLTLQYRDYAQWQEGTLKEERLQAQGRYWKDQFKDGAPVLHLPADAERPLTKTYRGNSIEGTFSTNTTEKLRALSLEQGTTLFITLMTAVKALLYRYSGQEDIVIGFPVSGRERIELEDQIGFYVNTLALRTEFDGKKSFGELLDKVKQGALAAYNNQDYPFNLLVEELDMTRDISRSPLFDVMVVMQEADINGLLGGLHNIKEELYELPSQVSKFDLTIGFTEFEDRIGISLEYNTGLFEQGRMEAMLRHLEQLCASAGTNLSLPVSRLNYLGTAEREALLQSFAGEEIGYDESQTIVSIFEQRAAEYPDRIAITDAYGEITYKQLNDRANQLARYLVEEHGVQDDMLVGLMASRSAWTITSMLAILKAGGAYVPIDPDYPQERKNYILEDSAIRLLITVDQSNADWLDEKVDLTLISLEDDWMAIAGQSRNNPELVTRPDNLAYVIYTSGSSGKPKGVLIEHYNVVRLLFNEANKFDFRETDVWSLFHSMCFDFSVWEIYGALLYGGRLVVVPSYTAKDPVGFATLLQEEGVTVLNQVPGVFHLVSSHILNSPHRPELPLRYIIFGGEALNPVSLRNWHAAYPNVRLINMYGITETTVHTTYKEIGEAQIEAGDSNIGTAIPTVSLYLTDSEGDLVAQGLTGELLVGGKGLARGYLNRPALTSERFINNPWGEGRLYRSGDLARQTTGGEFVYLGRSDFQVKIRGHRIELGEIEDALLRYEGVEEAVVIAKGLSTEAYLVAYYTGVEESANDLRNWLSAHLPAYMIPSGFLHLDAFALTSNGKIDRRQLPQPEEQSSFDYLASAVTTVELRLLALWEEVLQRRGIGTSTNFFEAGGHSLKAAKLVSRIYQSFGVRVELRTLFTHPTIAALATIVEAGVQEQCQPIVPIPEQNDYALSLAQRRLWILDQIEEDRVAYNMPAACWLRGPLKIKSLKKALDTLIARHEILRTRFIQSGSEPRQVIDAPDTATQLDYIDLRTEEQPGTFIEKYIQQQSLRAFNLEQGPLLRCLLLQTGEEEHLFFFNLHHIISDGWSAQVLSRELGLLYSSFASGRDESPLTALPIQYKDYAQWQDGALKEERLQLQKDFWKEQFKEGAPLLNLPADRERPLAKTYRGASVEGSFDAELSQSVRTLSLKQGVTPFITLMAAVKALLYRYSGQEDIVIGFPVSGRERIELEDQIGFYVNTLALRTRFEGEKDFASLLQSVRQGALAAYNNQDYPFNLLVEELDIARDISRSPLFDVMVVMQEQVQKLMGDMEGIAEEAYPIASNVSKFDLTISFVEEGEHIGVAIEYNTDLFDRWRIEAMLGHLEQLCAAVCTDATVSLNRINYLKEEERAQLLTSFMGSETPYPTEHTLHALFEAQAEAHPDDDAVRDEHTSLTYRELNEQANQLAHYLRSRHGVGRDTLVGLMTGRTCQMMVGMMGILKAGGAYVPIDPEYPQERKDYILGNSQVRLLLTDTDDDQSSATVRRLNINEHEIGQQPIANPEAINQSSDRIYIIYTSGTTGQPKGVQVTHRSIANLSGWLTDLIYAHHPAPQVVSLTASVSFDSSVKQLFPALINGGTLQIISAEQRKDPELYIRTLKEARVNVLDITPSYLKEVLRELAVSGETLPDLRYTLAGGESLPNTLIKDYYTILSGSRLVNVYGVTEAAVDSTCEVTNPNPQRSQLGIGKPIQNTRIYVLDHHNQLLPVGLPGELCIGGDGVSLGYIGQRQLTAQKFITDPFRPQSTLYRTGDVARWMPDGSLEFFGRNDRQVKIRGYRIEPGEIEQKILEHPAVNDAAVVALKDHEGASYLVGYYSTKSELATDALRSHLSTILPHFMIPAFLMEVDSFARTTHGKLDYSALPQPGREAVSDSTLIAPSTQTESTLFAIWQQVLGTTAFGTTDDFFRIGGDSLKAMKVFSEIYKQFGVRLPIREIFVHPTIAALAPSLESATGEGYEPIPAAPLQADYALSHAQKRLWILDQFEKNQTAYNITTGFELDGELSREAFEKALFALVERHEVLRTVFILVKGEPRQKVRTVKQSGFALSYTDLRARGEELFSYVERELATGFDLAKGPLLRVQLLQTDDTHHTCLITIHHIISDAWSNGHLVQELSVLYSEALQGITETSLPALSIQYKDFTLWQNDSLVNGTPARSEQYWLSRFAGVPAVLELPTGKPRPKIKTFEGDTITFLLTKTEIEALTELGNEHGAVLFMVLVALIKTQLYRYTGEEDLVLTTPVAGREHPDLQNQTGFYANTLALRTKLHANDRFADVLLKVKDTMLGAYAHQSYPFDMLTDALGIPYDPSYAPLSEVMVLMQAADEYAFRLDGLEVKPLALSNTTSRFDLLFVFNAVEEGLKTEIVFNTGVLDRSRAEQIETHFKKLIGLVTNRTEGRITDWPLVERRLGKEEEDRSWVKLLNQGSFVLSSATTLDESSVLHLSPYQFINLSIAQLGEQWKAVQAIFISGATLAYQALNEWFEQPHTGHIALVQLYGYNSPQPVAAHRIVKEDACAPHSIIGKALPGQSIFVLDAHGNMMPAGMTGEICISLNRPAVPDEDSYIRHPWYEGQWLLRTGDTGLYLPNGDIAYVAPARSIVSRENRKISPSTISQALYNGESIEQLHIKTSPNAKKPFRATVVPGREAFTVKQVLRYQQEGGQWKDWLHYLPNGLCFINKNKSETEFTYDEIFVQHSYLKHGIQIKPGDVIFDVGANAGMFALYASLHFPGTRLFAFEPLPPIYDMLAANASLYDQTRITTYNVGLSDQEQTAVFTYYAHNTIISGRYSDLDADKDTIRQYLVNQFREEGITMTEKRLEELVHESTASSEYTCRLRRLSDVLAESGVEQIDLLKIDVEKSEWEIIQGINEGDWKRIKQVIIEVHDLEGRLDAISRLLEEKGFEVRMQQDELLKDTNLYNLYAHRPAAVPVQDQPWPEALSFNEGGRWTNSELLLDHIRKSASDRLPAYAASAVEIQLAAALPLLPNGLVDEKKLDRYHAGNASKEEAPALAALVSATFTAQPMEAYLHWWGQTFELPLQLQFSAYNQVFQDLLHPASAPDLHLILLRFEDFIRSKEAATPDAELVRHLDETYKRLLDIISSRAATTRYLVGIFPVSPVLAFSEVVSDHIRELNTRWMQDLTALGEVEVIDFTNTAQQFGISQIFDAASDKLGHIPYTETFFAAVGTLFARRIRAIKKPAFKVIALDCDNTLWKGVCGEDGPLGVQVNGGYAALQQWMLKKKEEGFLLALISKNNEQDVWEVFDQCSGMILKKEHFAAWRINWQNKSANLRELATELSLGANSFCFIDDSAMECAEVRTGCHEALTLELPANADEFSTFLSHVWAFDTAGLTGEDRRRSELYASEQKRRQLREGEDSLQDFLSALGLEVSMRPADDEQLNRVAQLTDRTNQFNLNKKPYTVQQLRALLKNEENKCWIIEVRDQFGDYGLTGAVITTREEKTLKVDTLLLSCRVLGRNVEQALLCGLYRQAKEQGLTEIAAGYKGTERNGQVKDFLQNSGWQATENSSFTRYTLPVKNEATEVPFIQFYFGEALPERTAGGVETATTPTQQAPVFIPDHIGLAVSNLEQSRQEYRDLGYTLTETVHDPIQNVLLVMCTHETLDSVELIAAFDEKSPVNNILRLNGDIPYHLCYRVRSLDDALRYFDTLGEYDIISQPQPAVLFNNRRVLFLSSRHSGLIELLEDEQVPDAPATTGTQGKIVLRMVTPDLAATSAFYKKLGYYEDRISNNTLNRQYSILLQNRYYQSAVELVLPNAEAASPENDFLSRNGTHPYRLCVRENLLPFTEGIPYITVWNENITIDAEERSWKLPAITSDLQHAGLYEALRYSTAQSLMRIPVHELNIAEKGVGGRLPETTTEQKLCAIWENILHQQDIRVTDRFFKLGGNSIKATQVLSAIEQAFGTEIPLSRFFEQDTLQDLARLIEKTTVVKNTIEPVPDATHYDLSAAQRRLWTAYKLDPSQTIFHISSFYCIDGPLDIEALQQAMDALVARHESLRTVFADIDETPKQIVRTAEASGVRLDVYDLRDEPNGYAQTLQLAKETAASPFNLTKGPLVRASLFQVQDDKYVFVQVLHHIIFDGWSAGVEIRDLFHFYRQFSRSEEANLPALSIQYRDYAAWENSQLQGDRLEDHRHYWLDRFEDEVPLFRFPYDHSRPVVKTYNGATSSLLVGTELRQQLETLTAQEDISLFMLLFTSIKAVLYSFSGQQDIVAGVPYANRSHRQLHDQLGFYVNMLAIRTSFSSDDSFRSVLASVKDDTIQAYEHGIYPFDQLVNDLHVRPDLSRSPLFDLVIQMQEEGTIDVTNEAHDGALEIRSIEWDRKTSKYDLLFNIVRQEHGIDIDIEYNTDLLSEGSVKKIREAILQTLHLVTEQAELTMGDIRKAVSAVHTEGQASYQQQLMADLETDF